MFLQQERLALSLNHLLMRQQGYSNSALKTLYSSALVYLLREGAPSCCAISFPRPSFACPSCTAATKEWSILLETNMFHFDR